MREAFGARSTKLAAAGGSVHACVRPTLGCVSPKGLRAVSGGAGEGLLLKREGVLVSNSLTLSARGLKGDLAGSCGAKSNAQRAGG